MNKNTTTRNNKSYNFKNIQYQRLGQLVRDCEYFLGAGACRSQKYLCGGTPEKHAKEMLRIYKSVKKKPTWLCEKDIALFKDAMLSENNSPIFLDREKKAKVRTWLAKKGILFVGRHDNPWFVEQYNLDGKRSIFGLTVEGQPLYLFNREDNILEIIRRNNYDCDC